MATRDIKAGRASVELTTKDRMQRGLARARARLQHFSQDVQALGMQMTTAATGILAPMALAMKSFADVGDRIGKMAKRTGLSVEAVQSLGHAAERSGTDAETLEKGVRRMSRTVWDAERGLSTANDALGELGLSVADLSGLSPEKQFKAIADALSHVEDASRKSAVAQQIFGRSGTQLIPMLKDGRQGIEDLQQTFEDLGVTLSKEDVKVAEVFTDTLGDLLVQFKYGAALLGSALVPAVEDLTESAEKWLKESAAWVKENRALIFSWAKFALNLGKWLALAGGGLIVIGKLAGSLSALVGVTKTVSAAFGALAGSNPFGWALMGVGALAALAIAYEKVNAYTARLTSTEQDRLDVADRQRAADLERLKRLRELNTEGSLSEQQLKEASRLAKELNGHYDDLSITVDKATGEIKGLAGAFDTVAESMRELAEIQIESALMEARKNVRELKKEREAEAGSLWEGVKGVGRWLSGETGPPQEVLDFYEQQAEAQQHVLSLERRLQALRAGEAEAVTGGAEATSEGGPAADAAKRAAEAAAKGDTEERQRQLDRLVRLKIQGHEDEHQRALALIRQRYKEERDRLEAKGASAEAIHRMMMAQEEELTAARRKHQQQIFAEAEREADEWYRRQEDQASREQSLYRRLAREEINATLEGPKREAALRELDRQEELAQATTEAGRALINQFYDLKARAAEATGTIADRFATRGTFSARAAGLAVRDRTAERNLKANEAAAKNTKEMRREMRDGGLAFS